MFFCSYFDDVPLKVIVSFNKNRFNFGLFVMSILDVFFFKVGGRSPAMEKLACRKAMRHLVVEEKKAVSELVTDASTSVAKALRT